MAGFGGWGQLISAILSLVGGAGGMASGVGGTVGEIGSAVSQYAKPAAEMASAGGQFAGAIGSRPGGGSGSPQIGGGTQTPGITADQLRTGLASTRSQSQAAGVYGNQDYELENMAKTLGIDVAQLKQMMSTMGVA